MTFQNGGYPYENPDVQELQQQVDLLKSAVTTLTGFLDEAYANAKFAVTMVQNQERRLCELEKRSEDE